MFKNYVELFLRETEAWHGVKLRISQLIKEKPSEGKHLDDRHGATAEEQPGCG